MFSLFGHNLSFKDGTFLKFGIFSYFTMLIIPLKRLRPLIKFGRVTYMLPMSCIIWSISEPPLIHKFFAYVIYRIDPIISVSKISA